MSGGLMTQRWGWQPTAWLRDGLPTWRWRNAPAGLVTRRQMRAQGLAPGGAEPVAQVVCQRGRRWAWLYDPAELAPKRVPTPAQLAAVAGVLAARRWCPTCRRDVGYCIPLSIGECIDCHFPDPSATSTSTAPPPPAPTSGAITMAARTAVGPCRHCRQPLEHSILRDEDDQPVDWYLGRDDRGGLDSTCPSPDAPTRDCDMCAGTGGELGDPDAEWDCDTCEGTGHTADHQPDLLGRPAPHATEPLGATLPGPRRRRPGDIVTSRAEREDCDWQRDRQDEKCAALGHDLEWTLGPNSWRRGNAYHWLGRCRHDAAEITVGDTWTSCSGIRDARNVRCSGPGTAILTEIEDDRASELVASAVADFGRAAQQALAEPSGALCVVFGPEQPQRVDLLIVTNQRGDDPGAVRGITVHGVDPDEARQEIEPARAAGRAVVINLPGGPFRIPTGLITGYEFITCSCGRPS